MFKLGHMCYMKNKVLGLDADKALGLCLVVEAFSHALGLIFDLSCMNY